MPFGEVPCHQGAVKTGRRVRALGLAGFATAAIFAMLAACSNAGEGDRCEFDNGNDDCQNGLVCVSHAARQGSNGVVNPPYNNSDRCCPLDRGTATHPACTLNSTATVTDSQAPTDTGPAIDTGVVDAPTTDVVDSGTPDVQDAAEGG